MTSDIILGIDLGTTNSVATYWDGKTYNLIKNKDSDTFPSIIEFTKFGKNDTYKSVDEIVRVVQGQGAGEILINSIDNDGLGNGYDNILIETVYDLVDIPLIALGGVGKWEHFEDCMKKFKNISVSASNIFQYTENSVYNAHKYLYTKNMNVRPPYIETIIKSGEE